MNPDIHKQIIYGDKKKLRTVLLGNTEGVDRDNRCF